MPTSLAEGGWSSDERQAASDGRVVEPDAGGRGIQHPGSRIQDRPGGRSSDQRPAASDRERERV